MSEGELHNHDIGPAERDDALFVNLILIFQGAAMQQMGKIINPLTGKVERNLEQARFSIDTLAMLKEKTKGNLSADLERLLDSTLLNLRMNFVDESARPGATPEESAKVEESAKTDEGAGAAGKADGDSGASPRAARAEASQDAASPGKSKGRGDQKRPGAGGARPKRVKS